MGLAGGEGAGERAGETAAGGGKALWRSRKAARVRDPAGGRALRSYDPVPADLRLGGCVLSLSVSLSLPLSLASPLPLSFLSFLPLEG